MSRPRRQNRSSSRPARSRSPHHARDNRHAATAAAGSGIARMSEDDLYQRAADDPEILVLLLDGVQDPHNLGACLRSADGAGAAAIVMPRHHSAPVSETVVRVACGAAASVPVVSVGNLARCLDRLRDECGLRIVGTADAADEILFDADLTGPLALVVGSEESGIRRLTREKCDLVVSIPMQGEVDCLNVSNAAAVCLFETVRQRSLG